MNDKEPKDRGFKVTDRRLAPDEKGEPEKDKIKSEEGAALQPPQDKSEAKVTADERTAEPGEEPEDMGPFDFSQLILSLATSALIQMGEARHPQTGETSEDLKAAQQTIDILDMLKNKTKGNLEPSEVRLLDNVLTELRMRFIKKKERDTQEDV